MIYLKDYVSVNQVSFLEETEKNRVLDIMTEQLKTSELIENFDIFKKAVFDREAIVSTGIGYSIAIPHVKIKEVKDFFISVGVHKPGIDWVSLDNEPVHLIFLIGGPDDHKKYLQILAKLTLIIKNLKNREKLLACDSAEAVLNFFQSF